MDNITKDTNGTKKTVTEWVEEHADKINALTEQLMLVAIGGAISTRGGPVAGLLALVSAAHRLAIQAPDDVKPMFAQVFTEAAAAVLRTPDEAEARTKELKNEFAAMMAMPTDLGRVN